MYKYNHMHAIRTHLKEIMNLKERKERNIRGFGGTKGNGEVM